MAPRGTPKATPVIQRVVTGNPTKVTTSSKPLKSYASKEKLLPKSTERNRTTTVAAMKELKLTVETRQRTKTDPKLLTPKSKENKPIAPGSVTKSGKKSAWKRRPKPAHSGVPVPEKMRKLLAKCLQDDDPL